MYVRKLKLSYFYNFKTFITSFYRSRKTNRRRHNQLTMFYLSAEGVFFLRPHHHPYHPDIWFSSQQKPKYRKSYPLWVLMYILSSTKMIVMTDNLNWKDLNISKTFAQFLNFVPQSAVVTFCFVFNYLLEKMTCLSFCGMLSFQFGHFLT